MIRVVKRSSRAAAIILLTATVTAGFALAQQASIVGKLEGHTSPVYSVAWSPDGKSLATAGFDYTVRLWDVGTRKEIKKLDGHTKLVLAVAISPDGKHVLSGSQDKTAKIWEWPVFSPTKTFAGHPGAVQALAVKPDGKLVAAAAGKIGQDLGPRDRCRQSRKCRDMTATFNLSPGAGMAAGSLRGTRLIGIRLWKADLNHEATIESPGEGVLALAYLPNNQQLASAGSDGLGRLWQLPAIAPRRIRSEGAVDVFAISPRRNQARDRRRR